MGEYVGADLRIMDKKMEATKDIAVGSLLELSREEGCSYII